MRLHLIMTLLLSAVSWGYLSAHAFADETNWVLSERNLPMPEAASEALLNSVSQTPQPNVDKAIAAAPKTLEAIATSIAQRQEIRTALSLAEIDRLGLSYTEETLAGVTVRYVSAPEGRDPIDGLFVHLHGGAYVYGGGISGLIEALAIANITGIDVISVDYRMPPDHPAPAAVDDVIAVWQALLESYPASSLAMGGTSAGGGLALAAAQQINELGLNKPAALWLGTPWADLSHTGDSRFLNEGVDRVLVSQHGDISFPATLYAGDMDLKSPLISPVYGVFQGLPPTQLVSGTRDLFLSDTVRVHRKLREADVLADLHVYEGVSHADYIIFRDNPEHIQVYSELREFLSTHIE